MYICGAQFQPQAPSGSAAEDPVQAERRHHRLRYPVAAASWQHIRHDTGGQQQLAEHQAAAIPRKYLRLEDQLPFSEPHQQGRRGHPRLRLCTGCGRVVRRLLPLRMHVLERSVRWSAGTGNGRSVGKVPG